MEEFKTSVKASRLQDFFVFILFIYFISCSTALDSYLLHIPEMLYPATITITRKKTTTFFH